jgi:hypothetical protein
MQHSHGMECQTVTGGLINEKNGSSHQGSMLPPPHAAPAQHQKATRIGCGKLWQSANHRIASEDSGIQQCTMLSPHIMQHLRRIIRGKQASYGTPY